MANIAFSFDYRIEIECPENRQITYLSIPKGARTKQKDSRSLNIFLKSVKSFSADKLSIFYKTGGEDFLKPVLLAEINPEYPDKVAIAAVLAP